ncbi:MAG: PH domain-containing protein [Bdellovibrionales bacterium]|nr:PH domain-containing protein [Bdellovibrionales bacterium]
MSTLQPSDSFLTESLLTGEIPKECHLKERYPLSARIVLRKLFPWICILSGSLLFFVWANNTSFFSFYGLDFLHYLDDELELFVTILFLIVATIGLHAWLERYRCTYDIEDGHLIVQKGIFPRHRGIYPLSRITDVYCTRTILDGLFGLHTIVICTPTASSEDFAHIEGLTTENADGLCAFLLEAVEQHQVRV